MTGFDLRDGLFAGVADELKALADEWTPRLQRLASELQEQAPCPKRPPRPASPPPTPPSGRRR